jgi:hypothetical protein
MEVNDDAGSLTPRGVLRFFASNRTSTRCSYTLALSKIDV